MANCIDFTRLIQSFSDAKDEAALHAALDEATKRMGFQQFALGHHVDLSGPPENAIRLTSYDARWIEYALESRSFIDDPVHMASMRTAVGFRWSALPARFALTARQQNTLAQARAFGLADGFTVPVHVPGEYRGTCSFAAASPDTIAESALPIAQLVGSFAFEAARRIMKTRINAVWNAVPRLTLRQREALVLVGRGKSDPEIATLLGVTPATAHEHVENVRRAYGGAQRPHLIARALFDCQIAYAEVLT